MDSEQIKHSLTLLLVNDTVKDKTPETIVKAYYEILPEISKAFKEYSAANRHKARIVTRREIGL